MAVSTSAKTEETLSPIKTKVNQSPFGSSEKNSELSLRLRSGSSPKIEIDKNERTPKRAMNLRSTTKSKSSSTPTSATSTPTFSSRSALTSTSKSTPASKSNPFSSKVVPNSKELIEKLTSPGSERQGKPNCRSINNSTPKCLKDLIESPINISGRNLRSSSKSKKVSPIVRSTSKSRLALKFDDESLEEKATKTSDENKTIVLSKLQKKNGR